MPLPNITKLMLGTTDFTDKITGYTYFDRPNQFEYAVSMNSFYVLEPFPKEANVYLEVNNTPVFTDDNQPEYELVVSDSGTVFRMRKAK